MKYILDRRTVSTILGALRNWQAYPMYIREVDMIASDEQTLAPLTDEEIDVLCEDLNFGETVVNVKEAS